MKKPSCPHLILVYASIIFLNSCSKNDLPMPVPVIEVHLDTAEAHKAGNYKKNEKAIFDIHVETGAPIAKIYATRSFGTKTPAIHDTLLPKTSGFDTPTTFNKKYTFPIDTSISVVFHFTVEDAEGNTATTTCSVNPGLSELTNQRIYNVQGSNPPAYDFLNLIPTDSSNAHASIVSSDPVSNAAVFTSSIRLKPGTSLVKSTYTTDYSNATYNSIRIVYAAGKVAPVTKLSVGDVYTVMSVQSTDTVFAIIKVTAVYDDGQGKGGLVNNNDYIQFSVKK